MRGIGIRAAIGATGVFLTLAGSPASAGPALEQPASPLPASVSEGRTSATSAAELAELLERAGKHARQLEQMEKRASFLLRGQMVELDGEGKVKGEKELVARVTATPKERITVILSYLEDGADKTLEARKKQKHNEAKSEDPKTKFVLPFSPSVQTLYRFTLVERDGKSPGHVRIAFTPHERASNRYVGSAWVDVASGEILTMGLSPTKTPLFVDQIEVQARFENHTSLGHAPSHISFEAYGGVLFFRKHYRGSATLTEARIAF